MATATREIIDKIGKESPSLAGRADRDRRPEQERRPWDPRSPCIIFLLSLSFLPLLLRPVSTVTPSSFLRYKRRTGGPETGDSLSSGQQYTLTLPWSTSTLKRLGISSLSRPSETTTEPRLFCPNQSNNPVSPAPPSEALRA
uniref:Uncharacterized protein n=1 Tax=Setaria viridis TaxID=4556 RepID=A0A4U6TZL3_SETVI|nr:hypothetical protein SEVIR_7G301200v2 [Setaria viridis]